MTAKFEFDPLQGELFVGHEQRECGEHRTVGSHRAWCFQCSEWCYPGDGCMGCRLPELEDRLVSIFDRPTAKCGYCLALVEQTDMAQHEERCSRVVVGERL